MNKKRNILLVIGGVVLIAALVSGFVLMQPSAADILVQTIETLETINDAHAVVEVDVDTVEKDSTATIEVWGRRVEDGPGAFRLVVLESSNEKALDAVVVNDGENLWAYAPAEGKVYIGTAEEAKEMMADQEPFMGEFDKANFEHPGNPVEAVQMLLEYFDVRILDTVLIADTSARLLRLDPIPEQMPAEYVAVGGFINLWIDAERSVPLSVEYTGSSFGEINITVTELDINTGVDEALFTFEVPADAEVISFADLAPQSLSLAEAAAAVDFEFLTPAETPEGATLVDLLEMRGTIVQRYTQPEGGSFSVAQGVSEETSQPSSKEKQLVEVRGVSGTIFVSEDGNQVFLTWTEGDIFYSIAGDLTASQALTIAESLQ